MGGFGGQLFEGIIEEKNKNNNNYQVRLINVNQRLYLEMTLIEELKKILLAIKHLQKLI